MRGWLKEGQPACFPLPVFFFPQGFMTGTLQTFARKYQVTCLFLPQQSRPKQYGSAVVSAFSSHRLGYVWMFFRRGNLPVVAVFGMKSSMPACLPSSRSRRIFLRSPRLRGFVRYATFVQCTALRLLSTTSTRGKFRALCVTKPRSSNKQRVATIRYSQANNVNSSPALVSQKGGDRYAHLQVQRDARRPC